MKGSVHQRGNRWAVVLQLGLDAGRYRQRWVSGFADEKSARKYLRDALSQSDAGTFVEPSAVTVKQFADEWLGLFRGRPSTVAQYEQMLRLHILPEIGKLKLQRVKPIHIEWCIAGAESKGLSPKTVKHVYTACRRLFSQAVKWELLARNPAAAVAAPPVPRRTPEVWNREQVLRFLAEVKGDRLFAVFWLALTTGMRQGEILKLRWEDLDPEARTITVRRDPKTPAGVRLIAIGPETVSVLRQHRKLQAEERLLLGQGATGMVFRSVNDNPVHASSLLKHFKVVAQRAGLPRISFHALRHTHASLLIQQGANPKVVQERLGHADIGITLQTYTHLFPGIQEAAAMRIEEALKPS